MEAQIVDVIASRIKALRDKQAPTRDDLAEKAGLDPDVVTGLEAAERPPRPNTLRSLAKALWVAIGENIGAGATEGKQEAPNLPAQAPSAGERTITVDDLIPHPRRFRGYEP